MYPLLHANRRFNPNGAGRALVPVKDLWVATGRGMRNVVDESKSAYTPKDLNTVRADYGVHGLGHALRYVQASFPNSAATGYISANPDTSLVGQSELTVFAVCEIFGWWGGGPCQRYVLRKDQDGATANAQVSLDYFDDTASTMRMRFAIATSSSTGWTVSVDTNAPKPPMLTPLLYGARYRNTGGASTSITYFLGVIGEEVRFYNAPHIASGNISLTGGTESNLRIHHGGGAFFSGGNTDSAFPGDIYITCVTPRWLSNAEISLIARNPADLIGDGSRAAYPMFTSLPGASVAATANGVIISGAASVIAGTTMVAATATGALLTVDASIIVGTAVASPTRVWPTSDIALGGWRANLITDALADTIAEETPSDAEFVWRPLSSSGTFTFGLSLEIPVGTHTLKMRPRVTAGTGQIRLVLLDEFGNVVGTGSWQSASDVYTTLTSTITITSPATQGRIEAQA